jgi:hypothetical protein
MSISFTPDILISDHYFFSDLLDVFSDIFDDILVLFSTILGKTLNNTSQFFPLVLEVKTL